MRAFFEYPTFGGLAPDSPTGQAFLPPPMHSRRPQLKSGEGPKGKLPSHPPPPT